MKHRKVSAQHQAPVSWEAEGKQIPSINANSTIELLAHLGQTGNSSAIWTKVSAPPCARQGPEFGNVSVEMPPPTPPWKTQAEQLFRKTSSVIDGKKSRRR
jgi:hypothetical protein